MFPVSGPISDRLRKMFGPKDAAWTPQRDNVNPLGRKMPKDVKGQALGGANRGKKK